MTSYLYDYPNLVPALRRVLPDVCRSWGLRELVVEGAESEEKCRGFYGVMHGGYPGEEAHQMLWCGFVERLVAELPPEHGVFSIIVTPEWERATQVWTFKDRRVRSSRLSEDWEDWL